VYLVSLAQTMVSLFDLHEFSSLEDILDCVSKASEFDIVLVSQRQLGS
jgi:hypothetical protein